VLEFGLPQGTGIDGAIGSFSWLLYIGGMYRRRACYERLSFLGIPQLRELNAHSWLMSFETELEGHLKAYAEAFPDQCVFSL